MNKVTIIVTTYLAKSKRYLDLCMRSIDNLNYDKEHLEILIVSHKSFQPQYHNARTLYPHENQFYPAEAINFGMARASKDSKYFLIVNDDVILTKNALINLVTAVGDNKVMANATSPCDNGIAYNLVFGFPDQKNQFTQMLSKSYRYEDLENDFEPLMNAQSLYPQGIVRQPFLCIYATLIPRVAYEMIGDWDENYRIGQDDLDYSLRAHQLGIDTVSVLDSLVWHFGGVSVESTLNLEIRKENVRYFKKKWGFMPPGIPESFIA